MDEYRASVICDSVGPSHVRLTTVYTRCPRFVLNEWVRHRSFSFSVGSSRARPYKKQSDLMSCPIVFWGKNRPGMSPTEEVKYPRLSELVWLGLDRIERAGAWILGDLLGNHKQVVNRRLEPGMFVDVVCTGTEEAWLSSFKLRINKTAQQEAQKTFRVIARAYRDSVPTRLDHGEWHLPFIIDSRERGCYSWEVLAQISAARCARTSYRMHDGSKCDISKDLELARKLLSDKHMSPFEHQAKATGYRTYSGNLRGWIQYRKTIPSEFDTDFDFSILDDGRDYEV